MLDGDGVSEMLAKAEAWDHEAEQVESSIPAAPIYPRRRSIAIDPEEADIRARMDRQWTEAQRAARADHVVRNTDETAILPQVLAIWNRVMETRG